MNLTDAVVTALLLLGSGLAALAAIGIVRMPDLYTRMQSATKAGTLGAACVAVAVVLHFEKALVSVESVLVILFLFLTSPIASHLIARAAWFDDTPIWSNTDRDEASEEHERAVRHVATAPREDPSEGAD